MKNIFYIVASAVLLIVIAFRFSGVDFSKDVQEGIQFHRITLKEAQSLAKKENKLIFLDVYASWCGPCKMMKRTTFSNAEAGRYYNSNFINILFDAEQGEGIEIAEKYKVDGYPSFLFINSNGELILRSGGYHTSGELIRLGKSALKNKG